MPAGSTWSRSRSACCVVSAWTVESTTQIGPAAKSKHGNDNEMPPALASNGCSQPTKRAPKWAAPILSWPKSHNHGAEVLVDQFDLAIAQAVDAADDFQFTLCDRDAQDRRRRSEFDDIVDDISPDRILELVAGLIHARLHRRSDVADKRRQMARQRRIVLERFDRCAHRAAAFVPQHQQQRRVEDRNGIFQACNG